MIHGRKIEVAANCMKSFDEFNVLFEDIEEHHLKLNPLWCEYYEPSELDEIVEVPKEWLKKNLIEPSNVSECPPFYSVLPSMNLESKEFIVAAVNVKVRGKAYFAYAFVAAKEVTSLTIFDRDRQLKLYSSELLADDNIESLHRLGIVDVDLTDLKSFEVDYEFLSEEIHFLPKQNKFECPLRT